MNIYRRFIHIVALCVILALMLSSVWIALGTGHDCMDTDCPICACISLCLHSMLSFIAIAVFANTLAAISRSRIVVFSQCSLLSAQSPFTRKVMLVI